MSDPGGVPDGYGELRVGTSGYQYDHWRGRFYPDDLPKKRWFAHYAEHFDTVEINNTFYNLPEPATFDAWHDAARPGFRYALKFSRYGSHLKKLKDPEEPIERFVSRAERLKAYLGPILVQLPPNWGPDLERLDAFLAAVPKRLRWVIELRDRRWFEAGVEALLAEHGVALCVHDMLPEHPRRVTGDFVYLRFHGDGYQGSYDDDRLEEEAGCIAAHLAAGRDVYAYFNNDDRAYAVDNARTLQTYVLEAV